MCGAAGEHERDWTKPRRVYAYAARTVDDCFAVNDRSLAKLRTIAILLRMAFIIKIICYAK
jgi:hypothetical protein